MERETLTATTLSARDGPFALEEIKIALYCKCIAFNILQPLKSFFRRMELEWGDTKTAHATLRNGVPVIQLGRKFFSDNVKAIDEAPDVVMHEIMHHLLLHLTAGNVLVGRFGHQLLNISEDAIINAYLHVLGRRGSHGSAGSFAGFMKRFYKDEGFYAYLRPDSENLEVDTSKSNSVDQSKFPGSARFSWGPGYEFYGRLMELDVTIEEAAEFFLRFFPDANLPLPLLGSHDEEADKRSESTGDGADPTRSSKESLPAGRREDPGAEPGGLFERGEGQRILRELGFGRASRRARDNFARIVRKITQSANKPGSVRTSKTFTKRMPARLASYDLLHIERGRELFRRWQYERRQFKLFFDVSGSMETYIPFVAALVKSLRGSEHEVELYCWADGLEAVDVSALGTTAKPNVGHGTQGEQVAKFLASNRCADAVIITDNVAGPLLTRIHARVHLCLVPGSPTTGSFCDRQMVPNCTVHQLLVE